MAVCSTYADSVRPSIIIFSLRSKPTRQPYFFIYFCFIFSNDTVSHTEQLLRSECTQVVFHFGCLQRACTLMRAEKCCLANSEYAISNNLSIKPMQYSLCQIFVHIQIVPVQLFYQPAHFNTFLQYASRELQWDSLRFVGNECNYSMRPHSPRWRSGLAFCS